MSGAPATLRVLEIFDSLQGEGYWSGVPMTFVRLAGCNAPVLGLGCVEWCDTRESWPALAGEDVEVSTIVARTPMPRLCLTGGEPLLQLDGVAALLDAAHAADIRVHLETNGTIGPQMARAAAALGGARGVPPETGHRAAGAADCLDFDWVVVSPKPPGYAVAPGWDGLIDELKLVADACLDTAAAERLAAAHPGAFVCIQPVTATPAVDAGTAGGTSSKGRAGQSAGARAAADSVTRAVELVMNHPEWRLSLQTHAFLGIK